MTLLIHLCPMMAASSVELLNQSSFNDMSSLPSQNNRMEVGKRSIININLVELKYEAIKTELTVIFVVVRRSHVKLLMQVYLNKLMVTHGIPIQIIFDRFNRS